MADSEAGEDSALFVHRQLLAVGDLVLEGLQGCLVQLKLEPEGAIGQASRRWSMAIVWSRISPKVSAHPPYADAACRRRCGNGNGRSGVFISHMVDERKQKVLRVRDAAVTPLSQMRGGMYHVHLGRAQLPSPHRSQECPMSPRQRDAKPHAKARQYRRRNARERLECDRRQGAARLFKVLEQALHDLGLPEDLVIEIEDRLRSRQQLFWADLWGQCFPRSSVAARTQHCAVAGAGTRTWCAVKAASRNVNRPQDTGAW